MAIVGSSMTANDTANCRAMNAPADTRAELRRSKKNLGRTARHARATTEAAATASSARAASRSGNRDFAARLPPRIDPIPRPVMNAASIVPDA